MEGFKLLRSKAFKSWFSNLSKKEMRIVVGRVNLARIKGVLNNYKLLDKKYTLYEFKWASGMRVYFSLMEDKEGNFMLLLLGGNKNSQPQDILESKKKLSMQKKA